MTLRRRDPVADARRARAFFLAPDPQFLDPRADGAQALADLLAATLLSLRSSGHLSMMPVSSVVMTSRFPAEVLDSRGPAQVAQR